MKITFEIVPGESIGPFRLGMTASEIQTAIRTLSDDPSVNLESLGIVAWHNAINGMAAVNETDRCDRLGIRVYNNEHSVVLKGQPVNNISNADAKSLFALIAGELQHSYGGFGSESKGIDAVRWENSDPWIDSIFVMPPKR